jgi:hypothetical protein
MCSLITDLLHCSEFGTPHILAAVPKDAHQRTAVAQHSTHLQVFLLTEFLQLPKAVKDCVATE